MTAVLTATRSGPLAHGGSAERSRIVTSMMVTSCSAVSLLLADRSDHLPQQHTASGLTRFGAIDAFGSQRLQLRADLFLSAMDAVDPRHVRSRCLTGID